MSLYLFSILNLSLTLGTFSWFIRIYLTKRYLFVKPSIILLIYTHIFFQWPMTLLPSYCARSLENPYVLSFLINGYILCGLFLSPFILQEKAKIIWARLSSKTFGGKSKRSQFFIFVLFSIILLAAMVYFLHVPFNKTGLYTIFYDPLNSAMAREKSLKLVDSQGIKYLYSLTRSIVIPLLFSYIFLRILDRQSSSQFNSIVTYFEIIILLSSCVFVALTGERAYLAYLILLCGFIIFWRNGLKLQPIKIISIIFLSFVPPIIFTLLREGATVENFNLLLNLGMLSNYMGSLLERSFIVPFKMGVWYVRYVQDIGPLGIAAFEKLAQLLSVTPLNAPNIIALKYAPEYYVGTESYVLKTLLKTVLNLFGSNALNVQEVLNLKAPPSPPMLLSISSAAGYLLSYYGYLGIISFPLTLIGLLALDTALFIYIRLKDKFLIPCIASISVASLAFIQSDYTVALVTHGFVGILLLSWLLSLGENYFANNPFNFRSQYARG